MKTLFTSSSLLLVVCLLTLSLNACGGGSPLTLTQENFDKIYNDMSPADVRGVLGEPSQSTTEPIPIIGGTQTTYVYENNSNRATIVFKNDLVKEKHSNFSNDASNPLPPASNP